MAQQPVEDTGIDENKSAPQSEQNQRVLQQGPPREDPGEGLPERDPQIIKFKWNKNMKSVKSCDTLHMLYLLQVALEKVRLRTVERNRYFGSIARSDRYINHLDTPQIIVNFLEWHNEDKEKNVFTGQMLHEKEKLYIINEILSGIGGLKKGPATKLYSRLKKEVMVDTETWLRQPQPVLELHTWGWTKPYRAEKVLEECTVDEIVTCLTFVRPQEHKQDENDERETRGVFQILEEKGKSVGLVKLHELGLKIDPETGNCKDDPEGWNQKIVAKWRQENPDKNIEDYWKYRILQFVRGEPRTVVEEYKEPEPVAGKERDSMFDDGPYDGQKIMSLQQKQLAIQCMNSLLPFGVKKEGKGGKEGKPSNFVLRGGVNQVFRELKKVYVYGILQAAQAKAQQ